MLRHYLAMAARSIVRHKLYSFINVLGLSVALTCAILILLFVRDQMSWDDWIPDTVNLYRLEVTYHPPDVAPVPLAQCPYPVLTAVGQRIAGIEAVTHVVPEAMTVTAGDRQFLETVTVVDPNFFQVIRLPLVQGDPARVLTQPESIVLSQSVARKLFANSDPIGKSLKVSGSLPGACDSNTGLCAAPVHELTVTGVLRNLPHNTQLIADLVMPNTSQADEVSRSVKDDGWTTTARDYAYVRLASGVEPAAVLGSLKAILDESVPVARNFGVKMTGSELEHYHLTPFRAVHLTSGPLAEMTPGESRTTVYGFAVIGLLIVLVACFNFMNLATARTTLRAREIALRKVVGAKRQQLVVQFLGEAILTALVALAIALSLVEVLLPAYDRLLGEPIALNYPAEWRVLICIVAGAIAVGVLSGLYPALVLSRSRPAWTLKSGGSRETGQGLLRSALVVGQFAVSIGLGIAVLVVFRQINFARTLNLGFDHDRVLVVRGSANLATGARESLEHVLRTDPAVAATALSSVVPFDMGYVNHIFVRSEGGAGSTTAQFVYMSPSFPSLYGLRLLAGRFLSTAHGTDVFSGVRVSNVLINSDAAHRFGYSPSAAIGKMLTAGNVRLRVVGVLGPAIMSGPKDAVQPTFYVDAPEVSGLLSIRVRGDRIPEVVAHLHRIWRSIAPGVAMDWYPLNNAFNAMFTTDQRQAAMFSIFVAIAILIACLGLFGLAVFTAERRTKEIGIRKVSGARTADIVWLMLWRSAVPLLLANVIAWPVAYYFLHRWLDGYAYRISLNPLYFMAAGAAALLIAWATVYANTLHLARTSPVHALRYE